MVHVYMCTLFFDRLFTPPFSLSLSLSLSFPLGLSYDFVLLLGIDFYNGEDSNMRKEGGGNPENSSLIHRKLRQPERINLNRSNKSDGVDGAEPGSPMQRSSLIPLKYICIDGTRGFSKDQLKGKQLPPTFRPDALVIFRAKVL